MNGTVWSSANDSLKNRFQHRGVGSSGSNGMIFDGNEQPGTYYYYDSEKWDGTNWTVGEDAIWKRNNPGKGGNPEDGFVIAGGYTNDTQPPEAPPWDSSRAEEYA